MSLNDINLNSKLITQLYPDSLLEAAPPAGNSMVAKPQATALTRVAQSPPPAAASIPLAEPLVSRPQQASEPEIPTYSAPEPVVEYGNTPSLGGNKKNILILVTNPTVPYLPDPELDFLSAILGACRLSIADVAIVNLHHYPQPYTELLKQFSSRQVLLMGVTPQQIDLPFHFPHFQLQAFDQRTYLSALELGVMSQNRDLKMQLWGCLKNMFGV